MRRLAAVAENAVFYLDEITYARLVAYLARSVYMRVRSYGCLLYTSDAADD